MFVLGAAPKLSGHAALLLEELELDLPLIIVSGTIGEEHAVAALRAGERETHQARQQAELARREAERRMRRMIESAMVGVWFLGAEGRTSFMNQRMAQILGLSAEEASFARIWTLNAATNVLELQASAGRYTHIDGPHARVPVGLFKIGLIAEERQAHVSNDVQNDAAVRHGVIEAAFAYLQKPLTVEALARKVRDVLDSKRNAG